MLNTAASSVSDEDQKCLYQVSPSTPQAPIFTNSYARSTQNLGPEFVGPFSGRRRQPAPIGNYGAWRAYLRLAPTNIQRDVRRDDDHRAVSIG